MGVGWGGGGGMVVDGRVVVGGSGVGRGEEGGECGWRGEPLEELVPSKERRERRPPPARVPSPADFTVAIFTFCHGKFGN